MIFFCKISSFFSPHHPDRLAYFQYFAARSVRCVS